MKFTSLLLASLMAVGANADCYMNNPRGSNNRLNEASANRDNGARLFDSQNNNRGGYNACDASSENAFATVANGGTLRPLPGAVYGTVDAPKPAVDNNAGDAIQYPMMFYEGSVIQMEWAVQHGCGGNEATDPNKLNCNMVIQYVCDAHVKPKQPALGTGYDLALSTHVASGLTTTNNDDDVDCANNNDDQAGNVQNAETDSDDNSYGRHESHGWYCECQQRNRNQGLFVADQDLQGNAAIYTRQNAGGGRSGLECAEERDYYPYWAPTPWRDLAYLTDDVSKCDLVREQSQNVMPKQKCVSWDGGNQQFINGQNSAIESTECTNAGGTWATYSPWGLPEPDCQLGKFSRPNYLGNGRGDGVSPTSLHYNATLPSFQDLMGNGADIVGKPVGAENDYIRCAMRLRYNVSTDDYDPWNTDSSATDPSPITQNPQVDIGASEQMQIALNTDQYGRTFQDRSHAFYIRQNKNQLAAATATGSTIHNLNVRGKRGNIVETYPSTEYDFVPTNLNVAKSDFIHLQWCGSLTHNNGAPGGDGQTGNAGEGAAGTDKHNLVQMLHFDGQYPVPYDKIGNFPTIKNLFGDGNMCHQALDTNLAIVTDINCALRAATAGLYLTPADAKDTELNVTLDNVPAASRGAGQLIQVNADVGTTYMYMATRNNNFTNRGQKGVTRVTSEPTVVGAPTGPAAATGAALA